MYLIVMFVDCIRNGNRETIEEQAILPAVPGPLDAPEEAVKDNVSPTKESEEVEDDG